LRAGALRVFFTEDRDEFGAERRLDDSPRPPYTKQGTSRRQSLLVSAQPAAHVGGTSQTRAGPPYRAHARVFMNPRLKRHKTL
jgi:hypothetical protein